MDENPVESFTQSVVSRLAVMGRALKHRNYMLFFLGQGTSQIGTWMQRTAMGWLVYRLTSSEWLLGVVAFAGQIFTFFFSPIAGVLANRMDKRRLLVVTQVAAMVQATLLAALTLTGVIGPAAGGGAQGIYFIVALSLLLGLTNAFDLPIRQSFVIEMLERREDLPSAIALNSTMVNGAKVVGPALAGVLIAVVGRNGEGTCFAINAVSFIAVIAALLAMRIRPRHIVPPKTHVLHDLREGFAYALGSIPIRDLLGLLAFVNVAGMSYAVLMPVFAKKILHGDSQTQGFLWAATGCGAIVGALFLASRPSVRGLLKYVAMAVAVFAVSLVLFANSSIMALSLALLAAGGFGQMVLMAGTNTLLQSLVDDDKRGRVMSLYGMCLMGVSPLGNLLMGGMATGLGAPLAATIGGAASLLAAAAIFMRLRKVNRIIGLRLRAKAADEVTIVQAIGK